MVSNTMAEVEHPNWSEVAAHIGPALTHLRAMAGLSQAGVADRLSRFVGKQLRQGYVSRVEKGVCKLTLARLGHFASAFDCTPSYILLIAEENLRNGKISAEDHAKAIVSDLLSELNSEEREELHNKLRRAKAKRSRAKRDARGKDKTQSKRMGHSARIVLGH